MKKLKLVALATAAVILTASAPPQRGNWLATVSVTPMGSHVLGNPQAKVKVAEYVSYTCPHCAHFEIESDAALKLGHVQPGNVSVEVRHLVRDPVDMTIALLTNCGAPAQFFGNHTAFMRSQETWMKVMGSASQAQQSRWSNGPITARMRAIAADFRFYDMMARRGYNRVAVNACLGDQAKANLIMGQRQAAMDAGVQGTPSFAINGALLEGTHSWSALEQAITDALK